MIKGPAKTSYAIQKWIITISFKIIIRYEEQLEKKLSEIVTIVKQMGSQVSRANPNLDPIIKRKVSNHGVLAPILEFLKSPVVRGYRKTSFIFYIVSI